MRSLRIAYVLPVYWPVIGGCELHARELAHRLSARHEVRIFTLINNHKDKEESGNFWFGCVLSAPPTPEIYYDQNTSVTKLGLSCWEKYYAFALLRIQSPKVPGLLRQYAMGHFLAFYKKRLLEAVGDCDIIHAVHGDVAFLSRAAQLAAAEKAVPFVFTPVAHLYQRQKVLSGAYDGEPISLAELPMSRWGPVNEIWLRTCYEADALVAMTDFERRFYLENNINKNVSTLGVGPIALPEPRGDFRARHGVTGKPLVLFLGRLNKDKGVEELLQAARLVWGSFPDAHFVFMGPMEWGIEKILHRYSDQRVLVLGPGDLEEKCAALKACDVLCVPSVTESLGGVYLEAWFYGKPVIGAAIPPFREITDNGKGGIMVEPTPEEIARALLSLFENPGLGKKMGEWGRQQVLRKYNWDAIAEKCQALYFSLLQSRQ